MSENNDSFNIKFDDVSNYNKFRLLTPRIYKRRYNDIWYKIADTQKYMDLFIYINPYEYLYPSSRNIKKHELKYIDFVKIQNNNNNIINILLYKIKTNGSLFFWEINHRYKLIDNTIKNIFF